MAALPPSSSSPSRISTPRDPRSRAGVAAEHLRLVRRLAGVAMDVQRYGRRRARTPDEVGWAAELLADLVHHLRPQGGSRNG